MACSVRRVDYFTTTVRDQPGAAYRLLTTQRPRDQPACVYGGSDWTLAHAATLFPEDTGKLAREAQKDCLVLDGSHPALLVQGDDELGALAELHMRLSDARVNVYASTGVADGRGSFGYIIYVRPEEYDRAVVSLGL